MRRGFQHACCGVGLVRFSRTTEEVACNRVRAVRSKVKAATNSNSSMLTTRLRMLAWA